LKSNQPDRQQLIEQLTARLDDSFLADVFPEISPNQVREILNGKVSAVKKPANNSGPGDDLPQTESCKCVLYTDGASRGNPGKAGAGAVLFDEGGREIATCAQYLGTCTNNVAEYKALIIGLQKAKVLDCRDLLINLDSELIVKQIKGQYKVKNAALKPLFMEVISLLNELPTWTIHHVPRSQNARADQLANEGIDSNKAN
jgi:ribonuclease HI/probable phosphoglycerate mutase